ncbi:MAG: glycosyltransferase family 2 protein [Burkholderiales bacterium]|jgi:glycosyltransferase involved in cell wall biosynthesis|nr:glycosyltransferase family 2 protein [Burkholderiales bacterium]
MSALPACSIVIPAHCEAAGLRHAIDTIADILARQGISFELVLIDDGSTDGSWDVIAQACRDHSFIRAARLTRRFGKEAAMLAGLQMSRGRAVIVMDADLQHPPALIPEMLRLWETGGFDVVEGVKQPKTPGILRRLFFTLNSKLTGVDLREASDFKLLDRRVVDAYLALPERNLFFRGMIAWAAYKTATLPFTPDERQHGKTQWSFRRLTKLALTSITSFSSIPLHLITSLGIVFIIAALLLGGQTLYNKLSGNAVDGFTTVILLLLIIGSVIMLALGVIGEYLARIYEEVKRRPLFFVQETLPVSECQESEVRNQVSGIKKMDSP